MNHHQWTLVLIALLFVSPTVAQEHVAVSPDTFEVHGGEILTFTLKLNKPPNMSDWAIFYDITTPSGVQLNRVCKTTIPGQATYECEFRVPGAGPAGTWTISRVRIHTGTEFVTLHSKPMSFQVFLTEVAAVADAVEIDITPSQVQLLRREAANLQQRVQVLKSAIAEYQARRASERLTPLLASRVEDELSNLDATEAAFNNLATGEMQMSVARIFFDDLRTAYGRSLRQLRQQAELHTPHLFLTVSTGGQVRRLDSTLLTDATLRALEHNQLAYNTVAQRESLTFDLEVRSSPSGATISYARVPTQRTPLSVICRTRIGS